MIYCFDIDGTICSNTEGAYEQANPYPEVISRVNALYNAGHRIVLHTARGSTTGVDWRRATETQLSTWGVKYHELVFGKPRADIYIDDKAINAGHWSEGAGHEDGSPEADRAVTREPVFKASAYLDVTYSATRAPYGQYPLRLAQWLLEHVYKRPGRLLDLGCGRGEHLAAFAALGFEVAGVDISPRAAELAQGYAVTVADLEAGPLPFSLEFDFVFSKSVIEHMRHPERLFLQAWRVLHPGGTVVVMTPSWEHQHWGPFYVDHTHVSPFTRPALADALTIAGFEEVAASHFYQLPFVWRYPFVAPVVKVIAALPLPYRPYYAWAPWPDGFNKLVRFSKELMLLGAGRKPRTAGS